MSIDSNQTITDTKIGDLTVGEKIGKYVAYQRNKRNWSLQEFANQTKLTPSFLLRLEKGEYRSVGFDAIEKLAEGFSMTISDLLSKCDITTKEKTKLPSFAYFLKEKYQLPESAIEDMRLFLKFVQAKYSHEIENRLKLHRQYWEENQVETSNN